MKNRNSRLAFIGYDAKNTPVFLTRNGLNTGFSHDSAKCWVHEFRYVDGFMVKNMELCASGLVDRNKSVK